MQLLVIFLAVLAAEPEPVIEVAQVDSAQAKQVEIVSQEASKKGTELTIVLKPKDDRFSVDFNWDQTDYRYVKVLVKGAKKWDTVRYFPTSKHSNRNFFNLMKMPGVSVDNSGSDCAIEFTTPAALKLLPPGGRLMFRFASGEGPHLNSSPGGTKATPK